MLDTVRTENNPGKAVPTWDEASTRGVQHYRVMGELIRNDGSLVAGCLHIFMKCVEEESKVVRGFMYFETAALPDLYISKIYTSPPEILFGIKLILLYDNREVEVELWKPPDSIRPVDFSFKIEGHASSIWLKVDGWGRVLRLDDVLGRKCERSSAAQERRLMHVLSPPYDLTPETFALLLSRFVSYHHPLGMEGTVVYLRDFQTFFANTKIMRELMASGLVHVVQWAEFALPFEETQQQYFDQPLVYAHAILSFWKTNTMLYLADLDEYIALPSPGSLSSLINEGCLSAIPEFVTLIRFKAVANRTMPSLDDLPGDILSIEEIELWRLAVDLGIHPIQLYSVRSTIPFVWKSIVNPNSTWGFFVHEGFAFPRRNKSIPHTIPNGADPSCYECSTCACAQTPISCAFIVHLENLFRARNELPAKFTFDISWLWMYSVRDITTT